MLDYEKSSLCKQDMSKRVKTSVTGKAEHFCNKGYICKNKQQEQNDDVT